MKKKSNLQLVKARIIKGCSCQACTRLSTVVAAHQTKTTSSGSQTKRERRGRLQQKIATGREKRNYGYDPAKCHFCRTTFKKGEEMILRGGYDNNGDYHRVCLEDWLAKNPPLAGASMPAKLQKQEEIEAEFEKLRKKLLRETKPKATAAKKPTAKATTKRAAPRRKA